MSKRITMTVKGNTVEDYVNALSTMLEKNINSESISTITYLLDKRYNVEEEY